MAKKAIVDWPAAYKPLLIKYGKRKHPLDYKNNYQLLIMVILSARDTDDHINKLAPPFFEKYPDFVSLSKATEKTLLPYIGTVRSAFQKISWIIKIANELKDKEDIPLTVEELVKLPGIGRKSANVIKREAGAKPEGAVVDIHVIRVAPRIGITKSTDADKIEQDIMKALPEKMWGAGMAMSFLGREICRPKEPLHEKCVMKTVCAFYQKQKN